MADYQYVVRKEADLEKTVDIRKLIGKRVLSEGGTIAGYISEIRLNKNGFDLEGVVVSSSFGLLYVGKSYFATVSDYSVILNTELSPLIKRKKVITIDGKVLGRVRQVNRKGNTNDVESLLVGSFWRKYIVPVSAVKQIASSVLIRVKYNDTKEYIWKRPK